MSELKTNLQEILQEKQDKIVPENIKKDVQIFDVTGTYEGGGSSTTGVKLFETEEEMRADTTAKDGDLAIVYTNEYIQMDTTSGVQVIYFPKTVTFSEPVTSDISQSLSYNYGEEVYSLKLTPTSFTGEYQSLGFPDFGDEADTEKLNVSYTSTDGMTYNRTDSNGNPIDLGKVFTTSDGFEETPLNESLAKFFTESNSVFDGLYVFENNIWRLADTDLTLENDLELLPGVTGYGKSGKVVGSGTMPTLVNANQILPEISAIGNNGVRITGDGSIYTNMPDIQSKNNQIYSGDKAYTFLKEAVRDNKKMFSCGVNNYIYIFSPNNIVYKYDIKNNEYTQLSTAPYNLMYVTGVVKDTDIYLFGGYTGSYRKTYKYDTLTDTFTELADIPYDFSKGIVEIVGENVYLFGGNNSIIGAPPSGEYKKFCVYNITDNTYKTLSSLPNDIDEGNSCITDGTDIYVTFRYNKNIYKYSVSNNTFDIFYTNDEYLDDMKMFITEGNKLHLFGGSTGTKHEIIDISLLEKTIMPDIPFEFKSGESGSCYYDKYFYFTFIRDDNLDYKLYKYYTDEIEYLGVPEQQDLILNDKNTNLLPENLKAGVTCLGVEGTAQTGIDTSDATASANDIVSGKTAYVNGEKITGVIVEHKPNTELGEQYFIASKFDKTGNGSGLLISGYNFDDGLFRTGTYLGVNIGTEEQSQLAELIGLTADKIKAGETILGITGTYTGENDVSL